MYIMCLNHTNRATPMVWYTRGMLVEIFLFFFLSKECYRFLQIYVCLVTQVVGALAESGKSFEEIMVYGQTIADKIGLFNRWKYN